MTQKDQTNSNQLVLANVGNALGKDLFSDIDFNSLDQTIDSIGKVSTKLSDTEKELAMEIIDTWNEKVLARIHSRQHELHNLSSFLKVPNHEHELFDHAEYVELEKALAAQTGTAGLYGALVQARLEFKKHQNNRPLPPVVEDDTLVDSEIDEAAQYQASITKYNNKTKSLLRKVLKAERTWKQRLNENEQISGIVTAVANQSKNLRKISLVGSEKASVAKINVAIDNDNVRTALKTMFDFSKNI